MQQPSECKAWQWAPCQCCGFSQTSIIESGPIGMPDHHVSALTQSLRSGAAALASSSWISEQQSRAHLAHELHLQLAGLDQCTAHVSEAATSMVLHAGADFGSRAAAAGGVTTVMDMPLNQVPCITTGPLLQQKIAAVRVSLHSPADHSLLGNLPSCFHWILCLYHVHAWLGNSVISDDGFFMVA